MKALGELAKRFRSK